MHAGARPHLRVLIVSVDQALLRGDDLDQRGVPAMRGAEVRHTLETAKVVRRPAHSGVAAGSSGSTTFFAAGFAAGAAAGAGAGAATGAGSATAAGASLIMTTRLLCGTMRTPLYALTPATSIVSAVNCIDRLDLLMSSFVFSLYDWTRGGQYLAEQFTPFLRLSHADWLLVPTRRSERQASAARSATMVEARLRTGVVLLTLALARAEHGDTMVHTHDGPYNSLHRRDTAVRVRQICPLGGPLVGNTAITVSGNNFRDVGDVKCRFGVDEVQARLVTVAEPRMKTNPRGSYFPDIPIEVNVTTLECSSPGCRSPSCLPDAAAVEHAVPVEVSMNGVTFTGSGLQFTYYEHAAIHVSLLTPRGGPRYGGTQLLVHGVGFRDLTSGVTSVVNGVVNGVVKQGIKCKFGQNDMVNATKGLNQAGHDPLSARCLSPVDTLFVGTPGLQGRLNQVRL